MSSNAPEPTKGAPPRTQNDLTQRGAVNTLLAPAGQNVNSTSSGRTMQSQDATKTTTTTTSKQEPSSTLSHPSQDYPKRSVIQLQSDRSAFSEQQSANPSSTQSQPHALPQPVPQTHAQPLSPPPPQAQVEPKLRPPSSVELQSKPNSSMENDFKNVVTLPLTSVAAPTQTNLNNPLVSTAIAHGSPERVLYSAIAPRRPTGVTIHARTTQKAPRAKRRRLTGAGKRWSAAADQFVQEIPPVPCFSDPRRQVPMRDMRGWITNIAKSSQNLVWDRFMNSLKQEDLSDGGDVDICRYILSSVIYEAQDPNSARSQTRQAVNNAIKRELTCPKSTGQTGRGQTFRELFRSKATQAGFLTSLPFHPVESARLQSLEDDAIMLERSDIPDSSVDSRAAGSGRQAVVKGSDGKHVPPRYAARIHPQYGSVPAGKSENVPTLGGRGVDVILEAATFEGWNAFLQRCEKTYAGNVAYWTSPDLQSTESLRHFISGLVDRRNIHDLKRILVDFQWIRHHAEISERGIVHLVKFGYDKLLAVKTPALNVFEREGYRLIRNALMLIRPVLQPGIPPECPIDRSRATQLATQLYGRLLDASRRFSVVSTLLESIRIHAMRPWLRPLNPCFESPKTDIAIAVRSGVDAVSSAIAMSHDGELLLTAGDNHTRSTHMASSGRKDSASTANYSVRIWDVATGNCVCTIQGTHTSSVLSLAITRNKKHVISCAGSQLIFWNIMDDKGQFIPNVTKTVYPDKDSMVFSIAVLPDSTRAIAAHQNDIKIWNVVSGKCEAKFEEPESMIYSLDITPDGKYLLSGEQNGSICIWNIETQKKVMFFNNQGISVFSVAFMVHQEAKIGADASLKVVSGSSNSILRVWTLPPIQPKAKPYCCDPPRDDLKVDDGGSITFNSIRCAGKGTIFTGSDDGVARMWKAQDGTWTPTTLSQESPARLCYKPAAAARKSSVFIAASNDGRLVAASTNKPLIPVFDIGQYEETLRAQKGVLDQSYFPYRVGSVSFTDMGKEVDNSDALPIDLGVYFHIGSDSDITVVKSTELSTPGNLLQVLLFDAHERWIVFDENILGRRGGIYTNGAHRRGVAVSFREGGGLAFFEVEHDSENVPL